MTLTCLDKLCRHEADEPKLKLHRPLQTRTHTHAPQRLGLHWTAAAWLHWYRMCSSGCVVAQRAPYGTQALQVPPASLQILLKCGWFLSALDH